MSSFDDNSGKISGAAFKDILLPQQGFERSEVVVGPRFGVDTAVIDIGNNIGLAVSSDPLSLIPNIGLKASAWLSVHLLANDMATTGYAPMYAQLVLNLPPHLTSEAFKEYWNYIHQFCKEIEVAITGGHTGRIEGQNSAISGGGTMFLTAPLDKIITSDRAEPGDAIVVTKETALTSSSILAMSFPETVKNKLGTEAYEKACENFYQTSSLQDALLAVRILERNVELKAMHDVTEGGVVGAIMEMAKASGCGFSIANDKLPVGEAQRQITEYFEIDHRFCVGAGSMVMAVKAGNEDFLADQLSRQGIAATVVGKFLPQEAGFNMIEDDEERQVFFNGTDPYWEAFFKAFKAGLK